MPDFRSRSGLSNDGTLLLKNGLNGPFFTICSIRKANKKNIIHGSFQVSNHYYSIEVFILKIAIQFTTKAAEFSPLMNLTLVSLPFNETRMNGNRSCYTS